MNKSPLSGGLGLNYSTTLVGQNRMQMITEGLATVTEAVDDPGRADVNAVIQRSATEWAQGLKSRTLSATERMELASVVAQLTTETLRHVFRPAHVKALAASTALSNARDIYQSERAFFDSVEPEHIDQAVTGMNTQKAAQSFAGLGGLAATLGVPRLHDGWFRINVTSTSRGDAQSGDTEFRVRPDFVPWEVAKEEMELGGALELQRFAEILTKNSTGVMSASYALLDVASGSSKPIDWPGYLGTDDRSMLLDSGVKRRLHAIAYDLLPVWQRTADSLPEQIPFDAPEHAEVKANLEAIHKRFSLNSPTYNEFDSLSPAQKAGNIPALMAAIDGLLTADRTVRRVLDHGIVNRHGVAEEAFLLQRHLFHSIKVAQAMSSNPGPHTFSDINKMLARVVADEGSLLAAHAAGVRADRTGGPKQLGQLYQVYYSAAQRAGDEFRPGGGGPSEAANVARDHIGQLMKALGHTGKTDVLQKKGESVLKRATMGDMVAVLQREFGREDVDGKTVANIQAYVEGDGYFKPKFDAEPNLKKEKPALSGEEQETLGHILRLANATWKVGQGHRVVKSGDDSRGSPTERGNVFNPYDLLLASFDDPAEALFVGPVKDWLIIKGSVD